MALQHSMALQLPQEMPADLSTQPFQRGALPRQPPEEMGSLTQPFWVSSTDTAAHSGRKKKKKALENTAAVLFVEQI